MAHLPDHLAELARDLPPLMTLPEVLRVLHMGERTFRRVLRSGRITVIKLNNARGGKILITRAEVIRFLTERSVMS